MEVNWFARLQGAHRKARVPLDLELTSLAVLAGKFADIIPELM